MSAMPSRPIDVQRLRHRQGERLRTRDFRDQAAYDAELLAWHQRAVHEAFGVVSGLLVKPGSGEVEVTPGLAYDRRGRALLLTAARRVAIAGRGATTLVLRLGRRGVPELVWLTPRAAAADAGVRLKTAPGGLQKQQTVLEPLTRVMAGPLLGAGVTPPDGTAWEPWMLPRTRAYRGLQVRIDTTAAGFSDRPCYFAWLRWPDVTGARVAAGVFSDLAIQYVEEEASTGFAFRVVLSPHARFSKQVQEDAVTFARTQRLHVAWLGVQGGSPIS